LDGFSFGLILSELVLSEPGFPLAFTPPEPLLKIVREKAPPVIPDFLSPVIWQHFVNSERPQKTGPEKSQRCMGSRPSNLQGISQRALIEVLLMLDAYNAIPPRDPQIVTKRNLEDNH
jgi:hypothetical protein